MPAPTRGDKDRAARIDGYLRLSPSRRLIVRESLPEGNSEALLFIDLEGHDVTQRNVLTALQEVPQRLTHTKYVIFRWPKVTASLTADQEVALNDEAKSWAEGFSTSVFDSTNRVVHVGVVRFRVGQEPSLVWADQQPRHATDGELLQRALQVEVKTLLELGNAVWRPSNYHYELPSGQHAASFIRVADAFRSPRDVRAIASWLTPDMRDGQAVVADSATLVPLITDLHALAEKAGWVPGRVEMLDEYPRTKLDIARVVRPLAASPGVLAIMSVNSSGRYLGVIADALRESFEGRDEDWTLAIVVDKTQFVGDRAYRHAADADADAHDFDRIATWTTFTERAARPVPEGDCPWCKTNGIAQVVHVDPRTFEALALPGVDRQMPSYLDAQAATGFWDTCFAAKAVGVAAHASNSPSRRSRPQKKPMSVIVDFEALLASDKLAGAVQDVVKAERRRHDDPSHLDYSDYTAILVSEWEASLPNFTARLDDMRTIFGLDSAILISVDSTRQFDDSTKQALISHDRVLVFALGTVSGWNLRQLLLGVQDAWQHQPDKRLAGLVLHSRPPTLREWENVRNSYATNLHAIWQTFFPWRDPLDEEHVALRQLDTSDLSEDLQAFVDRRIEIAQSRFKVWSERVAAHEEDKERPDPRSVLWGLEPYGGMTHVRSMSLYGYEVDALTAYVAIGAAIHATRQYRGDYDPRWLVFDMPAITRSYYDGIIVAAILRWLEPQETWWGSSGAEAASVMSELLARTVHEEDQKVLFPELLYAASLGKIRIEACVPLLAVARTNVDHWPLEHQAPTRLGIHLLERSTLIDLT